MANGTPMEPFTGILKRVFGSIVTETSLVAAAVFWCGTCSSFWHLVFLFILTVLSMTLFPEPTDNCRRHASTGLVLGTLALPTLFVVQAGTRNTILVAFRLTWWSGLTCNAIRAWSCYTWRSRFEKCISCFAIASMIGGSVVVFGDIMLLPALVVFVACLTTLQKAIPHSFTLGEAVIVAELGAVLFHVIMFSVLLDVNELPSKLRKVIAIGLFSGIGISATNLFISQMCRHVIARLCKHQGILHTILTLVLFVLMLEWMSFSIGQNSLLWLWDYVTSHTATPLKFIMYYVVVLIPALALAPDNQKVSLRRIVIRKYFHVLALVMFVPTILIHIRFMALASAVALAIFMVLESLRISNVPMVVAIMDPFMQRYLDDRDAGTAVLTHIYLLMGCALPVFFAYFALHGIFSAIALLIALSGVTVTGLGDAMASYCGVRFGRSRWHGSKKTMEGSLAMTIAMFVFQVGCLWVYGFHNLTTTSWARLALADVLVALLEAKTDQIDNLFLPLYHVALLQMV